jgi:hypothetical protein
MKTRTFHSAAYVSAVKLFHTVDVFRHFGHISLRFGVLIEWYFWLGNAIGFATFRGNEEISPTIIGKE